MTNPVVWLRAYFHSRSRTIVYFIFYIVFSSISPCLHLNQNNLNIVEKADSNEQLHKPIIWLLWPLSSVTSQHWYLQKEQLKISGKAKITKCNSPNPPIEEERNANGITEYCIFYKYHVCVF